MHMSSLAMSWISLLSGANRGREIISANKVDTAKNEEFVEKTLDYVEQLVVCAEILRASPTWLAP